jgi:beta-glucosidase
MPKRTERLPISTLTFRLMIAAIFVFVPGLSPTPAQSAHASSGNWPLTPERERKVDELLKQMTAEEKIGQLNQSFHFLKTKAVDDRVIAGQIGSFDHEFDPAEINRLRHLAVEKSRLHIQLAFEADVLHGYRVTYPVPIGMAASFDMKMIEDVQGKAAFDGCRKRAHSTTGSVKTPLRRWRGHFP